MSVEDKFISISALMCEPTRARMLWKWFKKSEFSRDLVLTGKGRQELHDLLGIAIQFQLTFFNV